MSLRKGEQSGLARKATSLFAGRNPLSGEEDPPRTRQIARTKTKSTQISDLPLFADLATEVKAAPQTDVGPSLGDDDDTIVQFPGGVRV